MIPGQVPTSPPMRSGRVPSLTQPPQPVQPPRRPDGAGDLAGTRNLSPWVRVLAVIVGLVKAAPLAGIAFWGGAIGAESSDWALLGAVIVIIAAIPLTVIITQIVSAAAGSRTWLIASSALLMLADFAVVVVAATSLGPNDALILTSLAVAMAAAQLIVFWGAIAGASGALGSDQSRVDQSGMTI